MRDRIILIIISALVFHSCVVFKTLHKDKLIDFENNSIANQPLKLDGYYYAELEYEYGKNSPHFIDNYTKETGIGKIKYLSVLFIYEDGFAVIVNGIDGISHFYCADKENYQNTFESAHKTIEMMLENQNSTERRTKRICGFKPNEINNKGLVKIEMNNIKIQLYKIEMQNPKKDSFNSAYLYEINGTITSDSSFVINSETEFRTNKTTSENTLFKFRRTEQKPNIENYFKKNMKSR